MDTYITNIKDLVIQFMTNGKEMEAKAKEGDFVSCFQMGMVHLLGIKASIDLKKASEFFSNQSLADDVEAKRMLGFIAEFDGNYSLAFENYANAAGNNTKLVYIEKVIKERNNLQSLLKELDLPIVLNGEITTILTDYVRGGKFKIDASLKIATICDDQPSCILAAQNLCEINDYYSANMWLRNGNVPHDNPLYAFIQKNLENNQNGFDLPVIMEIIDIEGNKILSDSKTIPYTNTKKICDEISSSNKSLWFETITQMIDTIKAEEACRKKEEEERRKIKEALRKKREEEENKARMKATMHRYDVLSFSLFLTLALLIAISHAINDKSFDNIFIDLMISGFCLAIPYLLIWVIIRNIIEWRCKKKNKK